MSIDAVVNAIASLPASAYAIGVSGGADSVALLHVLHHHRPDVRLHVVHLDHEMRGAASSGDAEFVGDLARRWDLPCTLARRSEMEARMASLPANASARYRAARHALFRQVVEAHGLCGVILAHHADDQAETVMQRLLRGTRPPYLTGMTHESRIAGMMVFRPLLRVPREHLRAYLLAAGQGWREDASNASADYLRNRLRCVIERQAALRASLLDLHDDMLALRQWVRLAAPQLEDQFRVRALHGQPAMLAAEAARRWLVKQGIPSDQLLPGTVRRLVTMAIDAASPPRQSFPRDTRICRRRGVIEVISADG